MRDMRCANNGCYGLSKGTQSDGLISDTSTEECTSGSSTENLKEGKIFEKAVAEATREVQNESQNSTSPIYLESSTSLHRIKTQCQSYIRWGVLLSLGILLWVALWITDLFNPNPFLQEDVATAKKVTLKAEMVKKPASSKWWFFDLWSYACDSIISVMTLEIVMFLCCIVIMVYLEAHTRNKWGGTIGKLCYDQFDKSILNTGAEQKETDNSSLPFNILENEFTPKEPEIKSCSDNLSKFSHGDVRNLMMEDETKVKSKSVEKSTRYFTQGERSSIENRISTPLKSSHNINNTRKRSLQSNGSKNCYNFSRRSNNSSQDAVMNELTLNKPNFDLSRQHDNTKLIPEQSNLTCSIFNKSTSIMSEETETWFELPNSDQAEKVMHSFDMELEEFFKTRSSLSPISFRETTRDLQRFNDTSNGCECGKRSEALVLNVDYNRGIVSSSPAFQRFLVNLAKDRLSEPYL